MTDNNETAIVRAQLQQLLELARLGTWTRDLVSGELRWSDEMRTLLNIPAGERPTRSAFLARIHPDDRERVDRELDIAYAAARDSEVQFRVLRPDGLVCQFRAHIRKECDARGKLLRAFGIMQDVSVLVAIEEELRRQTAYLTAIVNHLPQGITVFDDQLRLQYWNARFAEINDIPPSAVYRNARFEDLLMVPARRGEYGPGDPEALVRERRALALKFEPHRFERSRPNGRTHLIIGEPLLIDGRIAGFITTYTDITSEKESERELAHRNTVLQTLLDNLPCGVSLFDGELRLRAANDELRRVLDLPAELLARPGVTLGDVLRYNAERGEYGPGDPDEIVAFLLERANLARPHAFDRVRPDGTVLQIKGQPLPDGGFVTIYNDVTELKRAQSHVQLADRVFDQSPEAIVICDTNGLIASVNPAYCAISGHAAEQVVGHVFEPSADHPTQGGVTSATVWRMLDSHGQFGGETWGRRADGTLYPRWLSMSVLRDPDSGAATHFIAIFTDITERKRAEADIQHLAHHDALTGLANRFSLYARLEQAIADARRNGQALAVLFLDLDRFKNINDSLGHHIGDALLVQVAQRLRASVREADVVARLGGDEFVVVLHGVDGANDAAHVAEKLLETLSRAYPLEGTELHVTPSIGISLFPDDSGDATGLMRHADAAMYHAKSRGRANFQFFTEELNHRATERLSLESALRGAVARGELELWYQPQIGAADGRVIGVEALIRWRHPDKGLIGPATFIPIAEETGLIVDIGTWVVCKACRQAMEWEARGIGPLGMSVNLSARQMRDVELVDIVEAVLQATGLPPGRLELEITESSVMEHPEVAIELLRALKRLGVRLAIDDFGTGHSSLSYLKLFPLDRLKIDKSFVSDIEEDANDAAIVAAAVSLAHNLGLSVIAEGVETATQVERLCALGCDELQGYHFSHPLQADAFEAFFHQYGRR
ncbi:MAG: EAL domain-containing protein [Rhodocyclaceae bacterium]